MLFLSLRPAARELLHCEFVEPLHVLAPFRLRDGAALAHVSLQDLHVTRRLVQHCCRRCHAANTLVVEMLSRGDRRALLIDPIPVPRQRRRVSVASRAWRGARLRRRGMRASAA
jgi:hypothetical protein